MIIVLQVGVYASGKAQQVSLSVKNANLKQVFSELNKQTGYRFLYNEEIINKSVPVTVHLQNVDIKTILNKVLGKASLDFKIRGETITIVSADETIKKLKIVETDVRGSVKDSTDMLPMPGVTIFVKDKPSIGTTTDLNGKYFLTVPDGSVLVFSSIGYIKQEIPVSGRGVIDVVLKADKSDLNEVVVIGFGKQKKESVVSSLSTVKGTQLRFPTRSLSNNLAGQIAGLIAIQRSGEPGYDNSEFFIRGISSFSGGTSPLILVDGIPRSMNDIEPDEIETFTLLKDAAATAVYGAEGANGVIIITSKRGIAQKTKISYRGEYSNLEPTRLPEFLGSVDYMSLYNESLKNEDKSPIFSDELIGKYASGTDRDLYPDVKWLDLLRDHTYNTRHTLNFRGGGDIAKYFVSGAYFKESGIFKNNPLAQYNNNIGLQRYNLRSNIDLNVTKTTILRVDLSGAYLKTNYPGVGTGTIFSNMTTAPPYLFPMVFSDGTIAGHPRASNNRINPYNQLMESGYAKEWRSNVQSRLDIEQKLDFLTQGLTVKAVVSYDAASTYTMSRTRTPFQYISTSRDANGKLLYTRNGVAGSPDFGEPAEGSSGQRNIYLESSLNYNRVFGNNHSVTGMLLTYQKETQTQTEALAFRKQAYVGRATYNYASRYSIEANFGITGSENFADGYRFGIFPAVGVAWYPSNEKFYPEKLKEIISSLKFRASIGRTGNDNVGGSRFLYRATFNKAAGGYPLGIGGTGGLNSLAGVIEGLFDSPFLSWEIEDKKNYGVDVELFKGAVSMQVDYFDNFRKNILLQRRTVSGVTGFRANPWQNFGKVSNHGIDASLNVTQNIGQAKLTYRGNLTFARNKILEYDEVPQLYPWMNITGTRLNSPNLYVADGLYANDDFTLTTNPDGTRNYVLKAGLPVSSLSAGVRPGDIKYKDLNGDKLINQFDQTREYGNPAVPELIYGFGMNVDYKGFYASLFFQGAGNTSTVFGGNAPQSFFPFTYGFDESSVRKEGLNRWTEQNPSQDVLYPRLHSVSFGNNTAQSTWWLRDASFIRLKNAEIGYRFPKNWLKKIGLETGRVYLMGNNIYVWDSIKMWDPEIGNANEGMNYPLPRTYTFGLEFNL
ncbi:TonB-dependent receptor [Pedobacter frigoris]|uniref:TonB-dependent receptor n=2 Tax=Pedobacter frigoris TaxID=2571272 RepID=A0A4V6WN71_9SPHI|nr:TonB-dependent receptor [Pedobacter frigoris]